MPTDATESHHEVVDVTDPQRRPHVLMVVANPGISTTLGWPVGYWAAKLFHPYLEFIQRRYDVTIASPDGGRVESDAMSDPRDESRWSADDLVSLGGLSSPTLLSRLEDTPSLDSLHLARFDALVVCGGQGPMFQFRDHQALHRTILDFYTSARPTAALCHGTCALLGITMPDGRHLIEGKTMTGFANVEEDYGDAAIGQTVMPFRIEDEAALAARTSSRLTCSRRSPYAT